MKLREYQHLAIDFMLERPRCALWAGMGLGKTVSTLTALSRLQLVESGPALIIAPKRVAQSVWPAEARKWDHLRGYEVEPVLGSPAERAAALRRDRPAYSVNYDNIPWLASHLGKKWPFTIVVPDEATRLKGFRSGFRRHPKTGTVYYQRAGGRRTAELGFYAHRQVKHFIELTGTPSPNGLIDLWGQMWFIDQGERLGRTYTAFEERWFRPKHNGFGVEPLPYAFQEITEALGDVCLTIDSADWFDLEAPIVTDVRVQLPPAARAVYRKLEKEMFAELEHGSVEAINNAALVNKCLQMAGGAVYTAEKKGEWTELHTAKLEALDSIVAEIAGAPLLVAYQFVHECERILKAFPQARFLDDKQSTEDDWNAGRIPILVAHPKSAGHGLNLQHGGHHLAFFGHGWDLEERLQIIERIGPVRQAQAGYKRSVFVYNILADDTVDEDAVSRVDSKLSVQDALLAAKKRRS